VVNRRVLTATVGWLAVAIAALAIVTAALSAAGAGPFDRADRPMSAVEAASALAALPPTTAGPTPSPSPSVGTGSPTGTVVVTDGGTARIECVAGIPRVDYVSPAPGFLYKAVNLPAPEPHLLIGMTSSTRGYVQIQATCVAGQPHIVVT
jgi:hypothetical protein